MPEPSPRRRILRGALTVLLTAGCGVPRVPDASPAPIPPLTVVGDAVPARAVDTVAAPPVEWRRFFADTTLLALIDTAVRQNLERSLAQQEVELTRNEALATQGRLLPRLSLGASVGLEKSGRYTSEGAGNASTDITPGRRVPEPLPDLSVGVVSGWELDIRGKLRNQRTAARARYLASIEGTRFVTTALVAEVANAYYELSALDAKLAIIQRAIEVQRTELELVRAQRAAAVASELAVKRFEALLADARSLEFEVRQQIRETENRLNLLLGRPPQAIARAGTFPPDAAAAVAAGVSSQLLRQRPDIRQAELELQATHFDVRAARAEFLPEVNLAAGLGVRAFQSGLLFSTPESMAYAMGVDLMTPLLNRRVIAAEFGQATARQQMALLAYRQRVLGGVAEVSTLLSAIDNLRQVTDFKAQRAAALEQSVEVARTLFASARADYLEVLTAQREAIDADLELVEARLRQRIATTDLYRALGGGWQ